MMDPDHQSLDPDPELESPDIPKRVEIRLRSRIQGRNRNTSTTECLFPKNAKISDKNSENCCVNVTREARATFRQQETEVPDTFTIFITIFCGLCPFHTNKN